MKISIFVHELVPEIGHSRAMIELINGLTQEQKNQVTGIEAVCLECADLNLIFKDFNCYKKFTKIPGAKLKPFLIKMFLYHVVAFFYSILYCRNRVKIGIGIASLNVDISNIQFIHEQWKPLFFKKRNFNFIALIYKKILFAYFSIGEYILFKNKKTQFIVIANFLQEFIEKNFNTPSDQITLIPSGVNTNEFSLPEDYEVTKSYLTLKYPDLSKINFDKTVFLFIGAFERKGLDIVLDYLKKIPQSQLILIGKPESYNQWKFPPEINIAHIPFTKEVKLFYAVSDVFIFPTYYEPFGLVITEAYSMGLDIIVPSDNVGASEIIKESDGIIFFKQNDNIPLMEFKKISFKLKQKRRQERIEQLKNYTWKNGAEKLYSILSKY